MLVDTLVKPWNPITDYRTQFSGITSELLADVTTDLRTAQVHQSLFHVPVGLSFLQSLFCQHVSSKTILVGHSLENDLDALKIVHENIIDTSIIYPHPAGFPRRSSLKVGPNLTDVDPLDKFCLSFWPSTFWER